MAYTTVADKAAGDVFTELMWDTYIKDNLNKGVVRPINEVTLASAAASIDFTTIAADWSHLRLVVHARGTDAATNVSLRLRFNGDTGANYDWAYSQGKADASSLANGAVAAGSIVFGDTPGAGATASVFSEHEIVIPHYAQAVSNKGLTGTASMKRGTTTADIYAFSIAGFWRSSAIITQVTIFAAAGNLDTGTRATLYGMGGV